MTIEQIEQRINELKELLERAMADANRQIGAIQGAIAENERFLELLQPKTIG